jgi:hypothetical protein
MNKGGFSWKRLVGISAFKAKVSRKIGVPLTRSGRQRKLGAIVEKLIFKLIGLK